MVFYTYTSIIYYSTFNFEICVGVTKYNVSAEDEF